MNRLHIHIFKLQGINVFLRSLSTTPISAPISNAVLNKTLKMPERMLSSQANSLSEDNFIKRIKTRLFDSMSAASKINIGAALAYVNYVDSINWPEFLKYFHLPDTFNSWFLAVQLHIWMLISCTIGEKNGRLFRNKLVEEMWNDVELRLNNLAEMRGSTKRKLLKDLLDQFQAAIISYDEGVLDDDKTLAASIWRTFFAYNKDIDPRLLELLVLYVRKQMHHFSSLNCEEVMFRGAVSLLPFEDITAEIAEVENM